jgi:hypothetical protein
MLREAHGRCWTAAVPGGPEGHHHPTEEAAARALVDRLMAAAERMIRGLLRRDDIPIEELAQLDRPCWTMRCSGCRQQLIVEDQRHWPSTTQARTSAAAVGWNAELELCDRCVHLVMPLKPRTGRGQAAGSAAG